MSPEHSFANQLVNWYNSNKRPLPWRETKDPYKIWLSEIILQQTRVSQGLPYYLKFMTEFPTIHDLAKANEQKVLSLWQGLGYYSRARNLHQCAIYISDKLGGKFPSSYLELLKLPGIGPYTAAAIASIAFGEAVPVVDGNVYRVLSRLFGIEADIGQSKNREIFYEHALQLIQNQDPDTFNQAMMEFGAMHCMPRNPLCEECFVSSECYANLHGKQESFPIKSKKIKVRKRYFNYIVFFFEDGLLMRERSEGDIWQGLNDFYCIESGQLFDEEEVLGNMGLDQYHLILSGVSEDYRHILTHQRIFARFFTIEVNDLNFVQSLRKKFSLNVHNRVDLREIPKPRLIDKFLADEKIYIT